MPPKRCSSICTKKKTIDECNADKICKYANGKVRQYCHLSSKYTFDNLCNIIHKSKKLPSTLKMPSPIIPPPNITREFLKKTRQTIKKTQNYNPIVSQLDKQLEPPVVIPVKKVYKTMKKKTIIDSNKSVVKVPSVHEEIIKVPSVHEEIIKVPSVFQKKRISKKLRIIEEPIKKLTSPRTRKASQLISNLLFKKRDKIRSNFLNIICSDSGFCIALGKEEKLINAFFDYFINFKYAISPVSRIGRKSSNGFIQEITYERENYKSYAVLKSQKKSTSSDSLIYEYFVGQYINTLTTKFPLFVKTYGLLKYNNEVCYSVSEFRNSSDISLFTRLIRPVLGIDDTITDFSLVCNPESYLYCILIEHLKNPIYIESIFKIGEKENLNEKENYELNFEILNILYQIYFVLSNIYNNFTHYDLHYYNVLLYKPKEFGYLTYHYHTTNKSHIIFDSQYIVKIIDYGGCFYKYDEERNSNSFVDRLCNAVVCGPSCGKQYGFKYTGLFPLKDHFINKRQKNASHDLRFVHTIKKYTLPWLDKYKMNDNTKKILDILNKTYYKEFYGTPENLKILTYTKRNVIRNIIQLKKALDILMKEISTSSESNFLKTNPAYTKLGDLHIYDDGRPMIYEAVSV